MDEIGDWYWCMLVILWDVDWSWLILVHIDIGDICRNWIRHSTCPFWENYCIIGIIGKSDIVVDGCLMTKYIGDIGNIEHTPIFRMITHCWPIRWWYHINVNMTSNPHVYIYIYINININILADDISYLSNIIYWLFIPIDGMYFYWINQNHQYHQYDWLIVFWLMIHITCRKNMVILVILTLTNHTPWKPNITTEHRNFQRENST